MENYSLYCHSCINYMYIRKGWANQYWGEGEGWDLFFLKKASTDNINTESA